MSNPTPPDDHDTLPPSEAVARLWTATSEQGQDQIRAIDPALARAMDRLVEYEHTPPRQRRPQWRTAPPLWQERDEGSGHAGD